MSGAIELALASFASASVVSTAATWALARRRIRTAEERAETLARGLATQREVTERRVREVRAEVTRLESTSLARHRVVSERVYASRLAPRDADELAGTLGGLAFVDAALVADGAGLALSRGTGDASGAGSSPALALSALAASVARVAADLAELGLSVAEAHVETVDARHVTARALRGRADGAFVLAATTSRPVSAVALDAVAQLALAGDTTVDPEARSRRGTGRLNGTTETRAVRDTPYAAITQTLEREVSDHRDLRALVLALDDAPVFASVHDGPDDGARARLVGATKRFADRAAARFRDSSLARVDLLLDDGAVVRWTPLAPRSRLALLAVGDVASTAPERLERLAGRLRRLLAESPVSTPHEGVRG